MPEAKRGGWARRAESAKMSCAGAECRVGTVGSVCVSEMLMGN